MAYPVPSPVKLELLGRVAAIPFPDPLFLVVEGGTGTPRANSYVTLAYAKEYFVGRRLYSSAWTVASDSVKIVALKQASLLLDGEFTWVGDGPSNDNQGLDWPRVNAYDRYNNLIVGVPKRVREATCEVALFLLAQDRFVERQGVGITSLRVDVISIVFDKKDSPETFPPHVARLLTGFGSPVRGGTLRNLRLYRV